VNVGLKPRPDSSNREVLAGLIERVTFHNAVNGFCVLRIKARGHCELVTVVGHAARYLLDCSSLSSAINDFGRFEPHGAYEARLRREHGKKSSFWSCVE
jgi:hypothetical protein